MPLCLIPGIAVSCGIIFRAWGCDPVFRHGSSADESNVLRWMCSCQSLHRCGYLLYFAITDSSLCLGIYDPNQNFHRILPSEQVTSLPRLFCPTEEKSITINRATNGDLSKDQLAHITSNCAKYYHCYTLFSNY